MRKNLDVAEEIRVVSVVVQVYDGMTGFDAYLKKKRDFFSAMIPELDKLSEVNKKLLNKDTKYQIPGLDADQGEATWKHLEETFNKYYQDNVLDLYSLGTDWRNAKVNTNWPDQQFRKNAVSRQLDLSVRGGNEKTRFFYYFIAI